MRGPEGKFQDEVCRWLRAKGCRVIKNDPSIGRQKGIPDITFFKEGFWGMFEFKARKNAPLQPGQASWIQWAAENSYGKIIYPEAWPAAQKELGEIL